MNYTKNRDSNLYKNNHSNDYRNKQNNTKKFNYGFAKVNHETKMEHTPKTYQSIKSKNFSDLDKEDINNKFSFRCRIEEIKQTSGPTIFTVNDGTRTMKAVGFVSPGERAFPNFELNNLVEIFAKVSERDSAIELEIKDIKILSEAEMKAFEQQILDIEDKRSQVEEVDFLVDNQVLRDLKPRIIAVAKEIRNAIFTNRPIRLKHHHDTDGYSAGIALERAIIPLIREQHQTDMAERLYYKRTPSRAPFYEYMDAVKDVSFTIEDMNRYGQKAPLIILTDNGSTEEDILAIKKMKIYGSKVVVVDHHYPGEVKDGKVLVDKYVDAHVNPYLEGHDSTMCAGILATEVARFVNKDVQKIKHIPAIAATGDRVKDPMVQPYFDIAEKIGMSKEYLQDLASCIDFESHYIRFMESRGLVNDFFGEDVDKQRKMVALLIEEINKRKSITLQAARHYMHVEKRDNNVLVSLEADKVTSRGSFPAIGVTTGMTHDSVINDNPGKAVITLGLGPDFITLRMSDEVNFKLDDLIKELQKEIPFGAVDGGGHEHAGTIKFLEAARSEVHKIVYARLREL